MSDPVEQAAIDWSLTEFVSSVTRYNDLSGNQQSNRAEIQAQAMRAVELLLELGHPLPAAAVAVCAETTFVLEGVPWPWRRQP